LPGPPRGLNRRGRSGWSYMSPRPAGASLPMYSSPYTVLVAEKPGQWTLVIPLASGAMNSPFSHGLIS